MIDISTPQMKRPRRADKLTLPLRAQTDACLNTKPKPVRTGPVPPFLDEFSASEAQALVAKHLPSIAGKKKKKRCWSANF